MAHKINVTGHPTSSIQDYGKYLGFNMEEKGIPLRSDKTLNLE